MSEGIARQEALTGFAELMEPIKVVEIGCGVRHNGNPNDAQEGRIFDLPYVYHGIEREEEFVKSTDHLDEEKLKEVRSNSLESGIIFGNAADLPFDDESVDVVMMRSVFGQFTGHDFREFENVVRHGLMESFRVLKPGGIIAISEENTPWEEDNVFHRLNGVGFTVIDYSAMQRDWRDFDQVDIFGRPDGDLRNGYAPENEDWYKKLLQFYGDEFGSGGVDSPRQYLMIAQKQKPADMEEHSEWKEWSVSDDKFDHSGSESTRRQKTYKFGSPVKQEYLPGMYRATPRRHQKEILFYMPPKLFRW